MVDELFTCNVVFPMARSSRSVVISSPRSFPAVQSRRVDTSCSSSELGSPILSRGERGGVVAERFVPRPLRAFLTATNVENDPAALGLEVSDVPVIADVAAVLDESPRELVVG
jgi:hypothetical protein